MRGITDGWIRVHQDLGYVWKAFNYVPDGGYFLKVRWDGPDFHQISYFGRYTHRESLVER